MGQDKVYLQVIERSGTRKERENAQKVLNILQRGRHWVLVSLLLGNVITNETLPIVLHHGIQGGLFAILASSVLIMIFGEIIPQSICAKYGLAIGAWSSKQVSLFFILGAF
jgi:metal transporter CNNM